MNKYQLPLLNNSRTQTIIMLVKDIIVKTLTAPLYHKIPLYYKSDSQAIQPRHFSITALPGEASSDYITHNGE